MDAVAIVEGEVRELIRRRGVDPSRDVVDVRRLVEEAVADYDARSLSGGLPPLPDPDAAVKTVLDVVAGLGPLQPYLDDPRVEEIWVNEPGKVFVARDGVPELTTTILTADQVRDLVERMLKSSGRRVDLSSPFVDAMLVDGSRLHVVIPDITRRHWAVNIRKFVVKADRLDDLVGSGHPDAPVRRVPRRRRRRRAERPGLGRDAGRQDDPAQLPRRRHPAARAGRHLRGGVRAQDPAARRRRDAVPPTEPGGHGRDPVAAAGQGGAADASLADRGRRGAAGGEPRPADRAEQRAARHGQHPREQRPRGDHEDVHAAAARGRERRVAVRGADRRGLRRPGGARGPGRRRRAPRPRGGGGPGAGGAGRGRDRGRLHDPRRTSRRAPTASRPTRTGSSVQVSTSPPSCGTRTPEPWALSSG